MCALLVLLVLELLHLQEVDDDSTVMLHIYTWCTLGISPVTSRSRTDADAANWVLGHHWDLIIYLVMMQEVVSDWDATTRVGSSPSMLAIRMMYMSPGNDTWVTGVVLHHCPCAWFHFRFVWAELRCNKKVDDADGAWYSIMCIIMSPPVDVEDLLIMMLQAARYSGHDATSQQAVLGQGVMGDGWWWWWGSCGMWWSCPIITCMISHVGMKGEVGAVTTSCSHWGFLYSFGFAFTCCYGLVLVLVLLVELLLQIQEVDDKWQ